MKNEKIYNVITEKNKNIYIYIYIYIYLHSLQAMQNN